MKKLMTVFLAAGLIFAVAGQASAAALETSGEYRGRYWFLSDYDGYKTLADPATDDDSKDLWDQRLRLQMKWAVAEGVTVNARADILENVWDTDKPDASEIDFDWAMIAFNWGATTLGIGKQDVSWGPGVYAKADNRYRAGIRTKFNNVTVGFAYDQFDESFDSGTLGDDYGLTLGARFTAAGFDMGVLGVYRNDKYDALGLMDSQDFMGIDFFFTGVAGAAKLAGEIAYGQGDREMKSGVELDRSGLMAYLGATMPLGPVGLGLEFGYAQGDAKPADGEQEDVLFHDYNGPFNSFILFNNFDLDGWNSVYSGGADKGLNNALALKASGTFAVTPQLTLYGALVWAQADETAAGRDDDMGVEVDLLAKYALTPNVTVQGGFGYLAAGDYYVNADEDPWVATAHAILAF